MKILLLNGQLLMNPSLLSGSGIDLPSDKAGLSEAMSETVKAIAASRLQKTDWYLTRFVGTGQEIPVGVKNERDNVYAWCIEKELEIGLLDYSQLLEYDATA